MDNRVDVRRVAEAIKDIDICMLVTRSSTGLTGRPMSNNRKVEYDGDSWFFSYLDSGKVREIGDDPRVELAYMATEQGTWLSIEGDARIVRDDERKARLWDKDLVTWFPDGPDDDSLVLLKVTATRVRGWINGDETDGVVQHQREESARAK
jgi:general stress protein 26